jgi:hypothetical protein
MCLEDFFPLHVLLPRVWSRPPSRSQTCLPTQRKVNQRRALVEPFRLFYTTSLNP